MHLVSCKIMLGGDPQQIVYRGPFDTVSWPEVGVLQSIHGEDSVLEIKVEGLNAEATRPAEKLRLIGIYGGDVVENVYPGRNPMMEMLVPGQATEVVLAPEPGSPEAIKQSEADAAALAVTTSRRGRQTVIPPLEPAPIPAATPYNDAD